MLAFSFVGCNYVLHSSGQLFSHKRKHERRLWEYPAPCKQPRLISSIVTSSEATASSCDDVRSVMPTPSTTTMTSLRSVQSSSTHTAVTRGTSADSSMLCATTSALQGASLGTQSSVSRLTSVFKPNISQPLASTSFNVPAHDPAAASSTAAVAQQPNNINESIKQDAVVSTAVDAAKPEMDTNSVDLPAMRRSPEAVTVDDDCVVVSRSSPHPVCLPVNAVEQSLSLRLSREVPAAPDDVKLEKLEKKEYVDLEDLAKITKLKQIVDEERTGVESEQHATNVSGASLTHSVTIANSTSAISAASAASSSVPSLMSSKLLTVTKCLRSGNEKKERDESWRKYLKRSVASRSAYVDKL